MQVDGRTVVLDTHDISALEIFLLDQYSYNGSLRVEASPGDTVIDAGACWGDTSVYFAAKVTPGGRVFSFEISQGNISVLEANLAKNPDLSNLISAVNRPLASDSTGYIWSLDHGAATRLTHADNGGTKVQSISIDDFVPDNAIDRVDFIKFDIEGEERNAIDGAVNTISRDKPSMAVSIYHLPDDPFVISEKVLDMCGDYKMYLKGVCKNYGETILFFKRPAC